MDIEKLIERLNQYSQSLIAYKLGADFADACMDAAATLSTLQAENEKLRANVVRFNDMLASYQNVLIPELLPILEQVKRERDAAVEHLRGQCRYCKRNLVCTSREGPHSNCWEWRGQKED